MISPISEIQKLYPNWHSPDSNLPYEDQKWIWENVPLSDEDKTTTTELQHWNNDHVNGIDIGGNKLQENDIQNSDKTKAITKLKESNYRTAPKELTSYLEIIFGIWQEKPDHWLFIAQHYTPKSINSVINEIDKSVERGSITLRNPGAYFTRLIKYHPKRKLFRRTNGSHKRS